MDFEEKEPDHKTIEALLSNVEAEHATVVRHLKTTKRLETSQVALLSAFISLMRYRVPAFADHIETSLRSMVLDTFKIMYQAGSFSAPPQELRNMFESKGIDESLEIRISNWKVLSNMFGIGLGPESISLLTQFNYHIYSAEGSDFFVSSDNPVALFHPNYEKIRPYGVGLATRGVEITLPLSSDTLIRAGHELTPGSSLASTEEVEEFNRRTIIMSESYVFAKNATAELRNKIGMLKHVSAGFVFDNLFHGDGSVHISRFIPVQ